MQILFLSGWFPFPPNNGSKLRIYSLLRGLARHHTVTLVTYADPPRPGRQDGAAAGEVPDELGKLCKEIHVIPFRPYRPTSIRALAGLFSPTPRSLVAMHQPAMAARIRAVCAANHIDLVVASQWRTAAYWRSCAPLPVLFEEVELGLFADQLARAGTGLGRLRHRLPWIKLRWYLRRLLPRLAGCTVVSEQEHELLLELAPGYGDVHVIPNGIWLEDYPATDCEPQPNSMIYTGALTYGPNLEAMQWFIRRVFPLVREQVPGATLTITGDHAGIGLPDTPGVELSGHLEDIRPPLARSWISVAPLHTGGGTRLKILEAMAMKTPVVATRKGVQGLAVENGRHALLAEDPGPFAAAILRLLASQELRSELAEGAFRLVEENYNWDRLMPQFLAVMEAAARQGSL